MPEGAMIAGGPVLSGPAYDDRNQEPAPDPVAAPKGWTWNRREQRWQPKVSTGGRPRKDSAPQQPAPAREEQRDRDPDPAWMQNEQQQAPRKQTIKDVPPNVRNDIAGFVGLVAAPVLGIVAQADPYCGGVLAQQLEPIVDAALPLICRSETITKWFSGDKSSWMEWVGLAVALRPVAVAVYQHHIARSVEVVRDEHGIPRVQPRAAQSEYGDHLTPPVDYNYAA